MNKYYVFAVWLLCMSSVSAETYIREYTYHASEADSKLTSRKTALDQVRSLLLQEIGTHISQKITITKDGKGGSYVSEDVEAVTAGLTNVSIIEEHWDGKQYYLKAKINADLQSVLDALKKYKESNAIDIRQQLEALRVQQRKVKKSRIEIKRLRNELKNEKDLTKKQGLALKYTKNIGTLDILLLFLDAEKLMEKKRYKESFDIYHKIARQGDASAQASLADMYFKGQGTEKNIHDAIYWHTKAAEQGVGYSQYFLGQIYRTSEEIQLDYAKAFYWYNKLAERGNKVGQHMTGLCYYYGWHVEQDYLEAYYLIRASAEQGWGRAQLVLGYMYEVGLGVKPDKKKSIIWYKKAAEQGVETAKNRLNKLKDDFN